MLIDRFLEDAVEIDVDALFDGTDMYLGGIMEHIEEAGIHSGDSACVLPPITLGNNVIERVRTATRAIAEGVGVRGSSTSSSRWPPTSCTSLKPIRALPARFRSSPRQRVCRWPRRQPHRHGGGDHQPAPRRLQDAAGVR